jgi:cellulose synthase/poly-beta-1,6-N-acetylglucosamine synthase-like glycosyltransferase
VTGAQWFEQKFEHILIKTYESVCGTVSELPAGFSCYRWKALKAENSAVLRAYFQRFTDPAAVLTDWQTLAITSFAEQRYISSQLAVVHDQDSDNHKFSYYTRFVKSAKAVSDGEPTVVDLIRAKARQYNGANFAMFQ